MKERFFTIYRSISTKRAVPGTCSKLSHERSVMINNQLSLVQTNYLFFLFFAKRKINVCKRGDPYFYESYKITINTEGEKFSLKTIASCHLCVSDGFLRCNCLFFCSPCYGVCERKQADTFRVKGG